MKTVGECAGISEAELIEIENRFRGLDEVSELLWRHAHRQAGSHFQYPFEDAAATVEKVRENVKRLFVMARLRAEIVRRPRTALPDQHGPEGEECGQPKENSKGVTGKSLRSKTVKT